MWTACRLSRDFKLETGSSRPAHTACQTTARSHRLKQSRKGKMKRSRAGGASLNRPESSCWFARHSKPLIFLILTLAALGGYLAFNIPVAVFPTTNFPRIVLAVDNGVMPIDQMMFTVTRPVEEPVNSVPGLEEVTSTTTPGPAETDPFFTRNVHIFP